jgi:hypothetical protein
MRVIGDGNSSAIMADTVFDTISDDRNLYIKVRRSIYICLFTISHWSLDQYQTRFLLFPKRENDLFDVRHRTKAYNLQLWHSSNASLVIRSRLCCLLQLARRTKLSPALQRTFLFSAWSNQCHQDWWSWPESLKSWRRQRVRLISSIVRACQN